MARASILPLVCKRSLSPTESVCPVACAIICASIATYLEELGEQKGKEYRARDPRLSSAFSV